jgi:hypothetical protein
LDNGGAEQLSVEELADSVNSRETFLAFVEALAAERERDAAGDRASSSSPYGPTVMGWENTTIKDFLEAAVACARDGSRLTDQPTWRDMALFLLGGKAYE